jgi:CheY-like chemotaxis protein
MSESQEQPAKGKPTVLIVDDSRVIRVSMKKILGDDYNVVEAIDGEDGWAQIRAHKDVRCVFTDYSMPELDGFGLLNRIKASSNPQVKELPVILVTGNEDDYEIRAQAKDHGFSDIVLKPFKPVEIRQVVAKYFPELQKAKPTSDGVDALQALRGEIAGLKEQNSSLLKRAEIAEKAKLEAGQELVRVKNELEVAKLESAASGRNQAEIEKAREEITRIQTQLLSMTSRAESAEAAHRKADQEISDLQDEISKRQHAFAEQQLGREEQVTELQEALRKASAKTDAVEQERQKARDEVKQLRTELMLRQQGAEAESNERVEGLRDEINKLHADIEKARKVFVAEKKVHDSLKEAHAAQSEELERIKSSTDEQSDEFERSKRMVERLRQDRESAVARAESSEESLITAEETIEKLRGELQSAKSQDDKTLKLKEAMVNLQGEVDSLRIDKEAAEAAQAEVENELVTMASSLESMEKLKDAAEAKAIELQAAFNDRREQELKERKEREAREAEEAEQAAQNKRTGDPIEDEVDDALESLSEAVLEEGTAHKKPNAQNEIGEVIEMSGFWPEEEVEADLAKGHPSLHRTVPDREPEVIHNDSGIKAKLGIAAAVLVVLLAGGVFMLSGDDEPTVAEVTKPKAVSPAVAKPKSDASAKSSSTSAVKTGTVKREPSPVVKEEKVIDAAPTEALVKAETPEPKPATVQKPVVAEAPTVVDVGGISAQPEIPTGKLTLSGVDEPVASLGSPFKEQEDKVKEAAETEFKELMASQKGGMVPLP